MRFVDEAALQMIGYATGAAMQSRFADRILSPS
jgi:hypothetical protein